MSEHLNPEVGRERQVRSVTFGSDTPEGVVLTSLDKAVNQVAVNLTRASPSALRWTKLSMNNWLTMAWPIFENSLALEMLGFSGPDVVEGLKAYEEKRQPRFNPVSPV
jgi:enoyl-CoA hydratase